MNCLTISTYRFMNCHRFSRCLRIGSLGLICLAVFLGCEQKPPPPDKVKLEQEVQQLNEHRQKEWNNQ